MKNAPVTWRQIAALSGVSKDTALYADERSRIDYDTLAALYAYFEREFAAVGRKLTLDDFFEIDS